MVDCVGREFCVSNIEGGEFSYKQVLENVTQKHFKLDIRFYDEKSKVAVLIETKQKFTEKDEKQLFDYVALEQRLSSQTKIIAILANTNDNKIWVWKIIGEDIEKLDDRKLKSFEEYVEYFKPKNVNDKTTVLQNTSVLNRLLHIDGIVEHLRSQFVGTCLLALRNGLTYKGLNTSQIIAGIKDILDELLKNNLGEKNNSKLKILHDNILKNQNVENIKAEKFENILKYIETNIEPYINDSTYEGHDILSYFFTTFNKYSYINDPNQAFTPNHISHFMAKVAGIYKNSRILDPTCGSGTFLVQAMTMALRDCETDKERIAVKKDQIYGIEFEEGVYGLATTNMLIHGDGNSNILHDSCFNLGDWIENAKIDVVLMNPPYNATRNQVTETFASTWGKAIQDPSKGFYFVEYVANKVGHGRLLTLLPMACAIQTDEAVIVGFKHKMLEKHTLDAVFSLPGDIFYPGASTEVCCMVFDLGKPHKKEKETFFGYFKDDGFEKRKNVGRVDIRNKWDSIEKEWLDLYEHRSTIPGKSVTRHVEANEEWCAEAYMETDYRTLCKEDFICKMRDYAAFLVQSSSPYNPFDFTTKPVLNNNKLMLETNNWKYFRYDKIFEICKGYYNKKPEENNHGEIPFIGATDSNNGITSLHDLETIELSSKTGADPNHPLDKKLFAENSITVSNNGSVGYAFYQNKKFTCSHDVNPLYLAKEWGIKLNPYISMFLCTVIEKEQFRWAYGRKWRPKRMPDSLIKLPIDNSGNPDWQWMEDYIKGLPYSSCLGN